MTSIFPFLYFMIRDLHVAKRVEDIGFYAGFLGAACMFGRSLTAYIWGVIADRWGRKPVFFLGLLSLVIFNTLFGLSTSYWMAVSTRFLLGALNGLFGPMKAYVAEVCRPEHQSFGISLLSTAWGVGMIVGPAIGGFLAQPAETFPSIFSKDSLFGRFPYFLPSLCISIFVVPVLVACIWLPESLHNHPEHLTSNGKNMEKDEEAEVVLQSKENLLLNWPLMSSVIIFCVFSIHDMAYSEIFSLWAETDRKYGGLSYSAEEVGEVLSISGLSLIVYQLFFYAPAERFFGHINLTRISAVLALPLIASYPFITKFSGLGLKIAVDFASVLKIIFSTSISTGIFILQNNAVDKRQRGAANGIALTAQSIFSTLAPAAAGVIFSWAQKRRDALFLPGIQMVFFILGLTNFIGLLTTFKPFLAVRS